MDTLPDSDVKEIWKRVKQYINPSDITADTREEFSSQLKRLMESAGQKEGCSGSMETLVKKGFADRVSTIDSIVGEIPSFKKLKAKAPVSIPMLPPKVRQAKGNRYAITTGKGVRTYSIKNLKITMFTFLKKPAYSVYNTRMKKRITWGVMP